MCNLSISELAIVQSDTESMLIISQNEEALSYMWWSPDSSRTLFYFEFENNLNDSSWNGNNPIASNYIWYEQVWWQYVANTTRASTGYKPYIQLNANVWKDIWTGDFTISFRFYAISLASSNYTMLFWQFNNSEPYVWPTIFFNETTANCLLFRLTRNAEKRTSWLTVNARHHVVFTRISWTCYAYVDKNLQISRTDTTSRTNAQSFYIFSRPDQHPRTTWMKADKYIYEKVWWTSTEVSRYYNKTKTIYWY